jgi:hypothetical protein
MPAGTSVENFRLTAALDYARMGWRVFPTHAPKLRPNGDVVCTCGFADCGNVGKHPCTKNGLKDATTDESVIRKWWGDMPWANVAVVTGAESGVVVVDVDADKGGIESWNELIASYGEPPLTPLCETGGGGLHFFFKHPGRPMTNSHGDKGWIAKETNLPGLDFRGDGGYVVAAPSYHRSDNHYAWRVPPTAGIAEPAPVPPWLMAMYDNQRQTIKPPPRPYTTMTPRSDAQQYWLGKALARATDGSRNDTGFWLATQLRDSGVSQAAAEQTIGDYVERCPRGAASYTLREAIASVAQAYKLPPREVARGKNGVAPKHNGKLWVPQQQPIAQPSPGIFVPDDDVPFDAPVSTGAADELKKFYEGVIDGTIYNVETPWPLLGELTQWFIPGTSTLIVGDPGIGKTYLLIQAMLHWIENGIPAAVYFIEKRRRFYTMRMIAYLEANSDFLNLVWIKNNPDAVRAAWERHRKIIDAVGRCIYSSNGRQVTLMDLMNWIRQMASAGKRVIGIDPLTAVAADAERWTKDDAFVVESEAIAEDHGASLVYITHSKKGNRPGAPTGHDAAGGAAYYRFTDTLLWMVNPKKPRTVELRGVNGNKFIQTPKVFWQIHKARLGPGTGMELAVDYGNGMRFVEQGVVTKDVEADDVPTMG